MMNMDANDLKTKEFFSKEEVTDSDEGESSAEYVCKVCTVNPTPLNEVLKFPDRNAIKQPMEIDGNISDPSSDTLPSLPSLPPSLETDGSATTICISSDEDLEESMLQLDTETMVVSLENDHDN